MEEIDKQIESMVAGELDDESAAALLEKINSDEVLKKKYAAFQTCHAAFEYEIASETRSFISDLIDEDEKGEQEKPKTRILYLAGIAATFLILFLSILTINLSHSDTAIANQYNINSIAARNGDGFRDTNFSTAVQAYFRNDFQKAKENLALPSEEEALIDDYKDWLYLMIDLKEKGSKSSTFRQRLSQILSDANHEFYPQALKLEKDVNRFWRTFVVRI